MYTCYDLPEPTMFNGDQACKNCIIPEEQKGGSDDECYCKRGGTFDIINYECLLLQKYKLIIKFVIRMMMVIDILNIIEGMIIQKRVIFVVEENHLKR